MYDDSNDKKKSCSDSQQQHQNADYFQDEVIVAVDDDSNNSNNNKDNNNTDSVDDEGVDGGNNSGNVSRQQEEVEAIKGEHNTCNGQQQQQHQRDLDDFLEYAYQATKYNYNSLLSSSSSSSQQASPSSRSLSLSRSLSSNPYHAINHNENENHIENGNEVTNNHHHNNNSNSNNSNDNNINNSNDTNTLSELRRQWRYWCIMLSLGVANSSDASEILCISYILSDQTFQETILLSSTNHEHEHEHSHGSGLLTSAVFLGMFIGGLIVGTMGDWIGRKPMLLVGLLCNSISGILSSIAWNVYVLSFLRMIAGIGIGATVPPIFSLATELSPISIRGFCVTIVASFWMVGSIFVAISALYFFEIRPSRGVSTEDGGGDFVGGSNRSHYYNDDTTATTIAIWRIFALVCALPSALGAILVYWFVPESPRFLGIEGRSKEAVDVANTLVEKMGYTNNSHPLTIGELERTFSPVLSSTSQRSRSASTSTGTSTGTSTVLLSDVHVQQSTSITSASSEISGIIIENTVDDILLLGGEVATGSSSSSSSAVAVVVVAAAGCRGRIKDCLQFIRSAYIDFISSTSKLYATPNMQKTTIALQLVWFTLSFGSYGLLTWINIIFVKVHLQNVYYNALLFALSNLPGNILSSLFMDRKMMGIGGRSHLLIGSIILSSISLLFFAIFAIEVNDDNNNDSSGDENENSTNSSSTGIVISACCFQCFTIMAWNTIDTMTSELFPTLIRSTGLGICAASGRIGALIAQCINGYLIDRPVKLLLVASGTLLLGAITPCLLPNGGDMTGQPVNDNLVGRQTNNNRDNNSNSNSNGGSNGFEGRQERHRSRSGGIGDEMIGNNNSSNNISSVGCGATTTTATTGIVRRTRQRRYSSSDEDEGE